MQENQTSEGPFSEIQHNKHFKDIKMQNHMVTKFTLACSQRKTAKFSHDYQIQKGYDLPSENSILRVQGLSVRGSRFRKYSRFFFFFSFILETRISQSDLGLAFNLFFFFLF